MTKQQSDLVEVSLDMREVHESSLDLLSCLEDSQTEVSVGLAALCLTLARLASPERMDLEGEILATQDLLQYIGMYFVEGTVN